MRIFIIAVASLAAPLTYMIVRVLFNSHYVWWVDLPALAIVYVVACLSNWVILVKWLRL